MFRYFFPDELCPGSRVVDLIRFIPFPVNAILKVLRVFTKIVEQPKKFTVRAESEFGCKGRR
jgi:hypothetical protein